MTTRPRGILAGIGVMGSLHLRVLRSRPDVELVALVDADPARREHGAALGLPTFASIGEAASHVDADFACVAVPAGALVTVAREALRAGLAVLVEKPFATEEQDALDLIADAEARGLPLAVGLVERCNPAVLALRERLSAGEAGRIYQVHARRLSPYPGRQSPTGVALDLATHDVDVIRFLSGSEVERVYAETEQRTGGGAEDMVCASLRLASGATGVLEVNWLTPTKVRQLSVTGEEGMFVVDYLTQDLTFYSHPREAIEWDSLRQVRGPSEGDMIRFGIARREPLQVEWDSFLGAVRGEGEPAAGGRDGLAALRIARAIQRSGREHVPITPATPAATA